MSLSSVTQRLLLPMAVFPVSSLDHSLGAAAQVLCRQTGFSVFFVVFQTLQKLRLAFKHSHFAIFFVILFSGAHHSLVRTFLLSLKYSAKLLLTLLTSCESLFHFFPFLLLHTADTSSFASFLFCAFFLY